MHTDAGTDLEHPFTALTDRECGYPAAATFALAASARSAGQRIKRSGLSACSSAPANCDMCPASTGR
jgi:hypothetical protein